MKTGTRTVTFSVNGEFITNLAREWFYCEGRGIEKSIELLTSCMSGAEISEKQQRRLAEDILLGRAEMKGNSGDGTFCLCTYDADDDELPEMPQNMNIWKKVDALQKQVKEKNEEFDKMSQRCCLMAEYLSEWQLREIRQEMGEEQPSAKFDGGMGLSSMLDSYLKRMTDEEEHSTGDYGWLEPDGTFHEVEWGDHQKWASDYLDKKQPEDWDEESTPVCKITHAAGDYLTERGWVLLHNPSQGIAIPTRNPLKKYTKAQQEFLYDYYMERGCNKEANDVWKEE